MVIAGALLWFTRRGIIPPAVPAGGVMLERGLVMAAVAVHPDPCTVLSLRDCVATTVVAESG